MYPVIIALLCCQLVDSALHAQTVERARKTYRPFTAKKRIVYIDDEGGRSEFTGQFFRRSDGSRATIEETEAHEGERGIAQYIFLVGNRSATGIHSFTKSAEVIPFLDPLEFKSMMDLAGTCTWLEDERWKVLGNSVMLGVRVVEIETEITKTLKSRRWVAPDLECFPMLDWLVDKGEVTTIEEALSIEFGEPDTSAFRIPAGYVEVSPVEFEELWKRRFHGKSYYGDEYANRRERKYREGKARAGRPESVR